MARRRGELALVFRELSQLARVSGAVQRQTSLMASLSPSDLLRRLCTGSHEPPAKTSCVVLDVRSAAEARRQPVNATLHVPVQELPERLAELPEEFEARIQVVCSDGKRSALAKAFLQQIGYTQVDAQATPDNSGALNGPQSTR